MSDISENDELEENDVDPNADILKDPAQDTSRESIPTEEDGEQPPEVLEPPANPGVIEDDA